MQKPLLHAKAGDRSDQPAISREGIVLRRGLSDALSASLAAHPLTLIIAPPVSGKTTLLCQTFSSSCGDRKLIHREARETDLSGDLRKATTADLFIIRGFDRLEPMGQLQLGETIEECLRTGPSFLLIADRPLVYSFAAPRMRGQVNEFNMADLTFSTVEAKVLLQSIDPNVAEKDIHALMEKTQGWPGAWAIIRSLIESGTKIKELVRNFSGADLEIARYFDQIIMPSLTPALRQFLIQIGTHPNITPEFADYLTGEACGWKMLEDACQHCLFLTWDSRSRNMASAHPLFRDYLDSAARHGNPDLYRQNLERAADWAAAKSNWLTATKLYSQAGKTEKAIEILNLHSDDLITSKGEILNYRDMRSKLEPLVINSPALASNFAMGAIFSGDFAEAAALLDSLSDDVAQMPEPQRARLEAIRISIDFGFERFQQLISEAPRWLRQYAGVDARYRAIVAVSLFWSYHAELNSPASYRTLSVIRQETGKSQSPFLEAWLAIVAAIFKRTHGRIQEAELIVAEDIGDGVIRHTINLVHAALALERGQTEHAARLIAQSLQEGTRHGVVETTLLGWQTAAYLEFQKRDLPAAIRLLEGAEPVVAHRHGERARLLIRLARATLILQAPETTLPEGLLREIEAIGDNTLSLGLCRSIQEAAQLALARFHTRFGDARHAISILQPIISASMRDSRWLAWTQASIIVVGAQLRLGNTEKALRQAWHIAERIADDGIYATYIDEHVLLSPLIGDLIERLYSGDGRQTEATRSLIEGLARRVGFPLSERQASIGNDDLARIDVHLTKMEHQILALASQGLSNGDISKREIIKLSTVKWHMQNVFGKLQVKSRTAAISEARRLGLLK